MVQIRHSSINYSTGSWIDTNVDVPLAQFLSNYDAIKGQRLFDVVGWYDGSDARGLRYNSDLPVLRGKIADLPSVLQRS